MCFRIISRICITLALVSFSACSLSDLVNNTDLPANVRDPKAVKTQAGALALYRQASVSFADAIGNGNNDILKYDIGSYLAIAGILTDEFQTSPEGNGFPRVGNSGIGQVDVRNMVEPWNYQSPYKELQMVRGLTREAVGALRKYYPTAPVAFQGQLFAMEGMSEVLLAELYCSGIPLSTVDFEKDFTLSPGLSSSAVYTHALALFDSAALYSVDSIRLVHFVNLGRARALLGLGKLTEAAATVAQVPDDYQYLLSYAANRPKFIPTPGGFLTVGDLEGQNGLPFRSGGDPRTTLPALLNATAPLVLASGVEARLIEVEAALAAGRPEWLTLLNRLRTTCTSQDDCPTPAPAGLGGVAGLPPLDDPALASLPPGKDSASVRVDQLFAERAYWLFLTGHRQGDLRRLVRMYRRSQETVYPVGGWGAAQLAAYGNDVTIPVPIDERQSNPRYEGCENRDA